MQPDKKVIGLEIKRRREALGLKREELAVKAKVSYGTVVSIEQGRSWSAMNHYAAVAAIVGVSLDELMGLRVAHTESPEETRARFTQPAKAKKTSRRASGNRPSTEPARDLRERTRDKVPA